MQPNQYPNPFQYPVAQPAAPQTAPQGQYPPAGIAPQGAGAPVPAPAYGQPTQYGAPAPQYGAPAPGPMMPFGDPFAAVASAALTRGQKLYYKGTERVLAEIVRCKLNSGQKGIAFVVETRVLWSEKGLNPVGSEPSVVLKQGSFYFGSEVKTWMCALLGLVAGRDQAHVAQLDGVAGQWSQLCALACSSPDNQMQGPGPFAGTIVLLDAYRKRKVDKSGNPKVLQPGEDPEIDLVRPEAVAQVVGDALRFLRSSANPQDPQVQQHLEIVRQAIERQLPVPAYDPNALAARVQAACQAPPAAPAQPAQPAPSYGPPAGYGQPQPGYGAPAQQPGHGYAPPSGYVGPAGVTY